MMHPMSELPPCGLYRTGRPLGDQIPAGRLVFFHRHGDPGPGVYLPSGWTCNRARWHERGYTIPSTEWAQSLEPLPPEGLYRVVEAFACCEQRCQTFEPDMLVQLGYDAAAQPLLFVPVWTATGLAFPELGTAVDDDRLACLAPLTVADAEDDEGEATVH